MLSLVLNELRPDVWSLLVEALQQEPGIELSKEAVWAFNSRSDLDAVVLPERLAYEWYGGRPKRQVAPHVAVGETQVLSTRTLQVLPLHAPPNMPP